MMNLSPEVPVSGFFRSAGNISLFDAGRAGFLRRRVQRISLNGKALSVWPKAGMHIANKCIAAWHIGGIRYRHPWIPFDE